VVCLQRYAGRYVSDLLKSTKSPCLDSKAARNSLRFDFVFIHLMKTTLTTRFTFG